MGKKNITFSDIAKYTGFSKTTISRYFNNPDSLTLENQQIIATALEKLNYKENKVARILANGKTEFIGIIIPNLYMHYYSEILNQILKTYDSFGYKFLVFTGDDHESTERKYIQELLAYKIEGMIILSHTIPSIELASYNIPIVTIEREDQFVSSVNTDNYMGALQATSLLIRDKCDILIHINTDVAKEIPSYKRIEAFKKACEDRNSKYTCYLSHLGHNFEETYINMSKLYDDIEKNYPNMKKGIFVSNDTHANILLNILIKNKKKIPDEYEIIGFDNSPISVESIIPITTVNQDINKIADTAMKLILRQINSKNRGNSVKLENITIDTDLIIRDTTS